MRNEPPVSLSRAENEVSRRAILRLKLEARGHDPGAKAARLRRILKRARRGAAACACDVWRLRAEHVLGPGPARVRKTRQNNNLGWILIQSEPKSSLKETSPVDKARKELPAP